MDILFCLGLDIYNLVLDSNIAQSPLVILYDIRTLVFKNERDHVVILGFSEEQVEKTLGIQIYILMGFRNLRNNSLHIYCLADIDSDKSHTNFANGKWFNASDFFNGQVGFQLCRDG